MITDHRSKCVTERRDRDCVFRASVTVDNQNTYPGHTESSAVEQTTNLLCLNDARSGFQNYST
jgi:hypothetical protein